MKVRLLGIPIEDGAGRMGCEMGPSAYRTAGIVEAITELGHEVEDLGNVKRGPLPTVTPPFPHLRRLPEIAAWIDTVTEAAHHAADGAFPVFLGGDHALAAGTVPGIARRAAEEGRPLFVLWLDAHTDFHTLETTQSGNLHGTPVAYFTGMNGFHGCYPSLSHVVPPGNVTMVGIRSVDPAERRAIAGSGVTVHDMRALDEHGVGALVWRFLERVAAANGRLHVSLDVDFLDPSIAPGVGTTAPGGATFREAHLIMEMLHDSGLVSSIDLVELNPFLDERGRTATLMVDLLASLMGRTVMDRPTRSFAA
ncbi:arginase [Pleomorphomonas sp. PLEO]|uniref:arginase n=1 Tax=Pleomorphomonas sp. PLEO TaxID=3239306 RepID=UPI00351EEBF3